MDILKMLINSLSGKDSPLKNMDLGMEDLTNLFKPDADSQKKKNTIAKVTPLVEGGLLNAIEHSTAELGGKAFIVIDNVDGTLDGKPTGKKIPMVSICTMEGNVMKPHTRIPFVRIGDYIIDSADKVKAKKLLEAENQSPPDEPKE